MDILKKLGSFVSVVSGLAADKVILARSNYLQSDFTDNIALVDFLTSPTIARTNKFNGTGEELTYRTYYKAQFTVDFYGTDALTNANKFIARLASQVAAEHKRDNELEVFYSKNLTNLKNIQGKTIYNRFQLEIMVKYSLEFTEEVKRMDTVKLTVNTNDVKLVEINT